MNPDQKELLIKKGKEAFQQGEALKAGEYFKLAEYPLGLQDVGNYFYSKNQPLLAYGYFKKAQDGKMLDKIGNAFSFALRCWMNPDGVVTSLKESGIPEKNNVTKLQKEYEGPLYLGRDYKVD